MMLTEPSGNALYQYLSGFSATLAVVNSGMIYGWSAPSLPKLLDESSPIKIDEDMGYWLVTMPLFGALLGDLIMPLIVDYIGRHKTILLTSVPYLICWVMMFFSTNYPLMIAARFIGGVATSIAFCVVPMYVGEIAEPRIRGLLISSMSVSSIGGMLLINIIGSYCSLEITALIPLIVTISGAAIFFFMPESPYFLIMKGKQEAAKKNLQILRGSETVDKELVRIEKGIEEITSKKRNPLDLVRISSNRKAIIILLCLTLCINFSGEAAINFYAQNIFKEAGSDISEKIASIILFSIELVAKIASTGIVDRAGRRPLLIFSAIGSAISLVLEGIYFYLKLNTDLDLSSFTTVPLIALISFVICSSAGLKIVPVVMFGELFPQDVKATALCVNDIFAVGVVTSVTKFFQVTRDEIGMYFPFISFGVLTMVGLVFFIFCIPETKGKTLEEIQDYLKGNASKTSKSSVDE